ncbi:MAG: hypothetical protein AAF394_16340, partial [Planctomycetota bacterium]
MMHAKIVLVATLVCCSVGVAQPASEQPEPESNPQSLAQFIFDMIELDGVERGLALIDEYKDSSKFYFSEAEFYKTGHVLYQKGAIDDALSVMQAAKAHFPKIKRSLALHLFEIAHKDGASNAAEWLAANRNSKEFDIVEREFDLSISTLLKAGKTLEAKVLAELCVQKFPKSSDAQHHLADIYATLGQDELALQKYRECLALKSGNNFFTLAVEPATSYSPTVLPDDVTKLFEASGNSESKTAFVFVQGGPDPALGVYRRDPLSLLPDQNEILRVHISQAQILNPKLLASSPVLTESQCLFEHGQSAEMLSRTVAYLKKQHEKVFVIGHSYGCAIALEYLYSKENVADKVVLMASDLDEDLRNFEVEKGTGKLVRWVDGVEPYEKQFFGDFPMLPLLRKDLDRIFANTDLLVESHSKRRFTKLLDGRDLSNVVFVHARFDESNGRTKPHELEFLRSHGAQTVETFGDHDSMLSPSFMSNLYYHLKDGAVLKQSVAARLRSDIDSLGAQKAIARYRQNKDSAKWHPIVEEEVNLLGYQFVKQGRLDDALAVFQLNVESFPNSWNVYDSLAETYLAKGETELARVNYTKSLEIHP